MIINIVKNIKIIHPKDLKCSIFCPKKWVQNKLRRVAELRQKAIWDENNMIATAKGREEERKEIAKKLLKKIYQ